MKYSYDVEIILIDDSNINEMVRIWNENRDSLSEPDSDKRQTTTSLNELREQEPVEFYGVIVDEDINDDLGGFFVLEKGDDTVILKQMAIDDDHKRKGVGDAILRYCKYQAKEKYDNNLKLNVYAHNIGGINFFFAMGFKIEQYNRETQEYTMVLK